MSLGKIKVIDGGKLMDTYAYMIRRDGKVFNVDFHPYGTEGIEYVLDYL